MRTAPGCTVEFEVAGPTLCMIPWGSPPVREGPCDPNSRFPVLLSDRTQDKGYGEFGRHDSGRFDEPAEGFVRRYRGGERFTMSDSFTDLDPLDRLAEEFIARQRAGERPSVAEYARRLPERAAEIHDLFPALIEVELLEPATDDRTGDYAPRAGPRPPRPGR